MHEFSSGFIHLFAEGVRTHPDKVFARFEGTPICFADLDHWSDSIACRLRQMGIGRGERVAVMLRNRAEMLPLLFGFAKAGIVWVPINVRLRGSNLQTLLAKSRTKLLIVEQDLLDVVNACGAGDECPKILQAGTPERPGEFERLLEARARFSERLPDGQAIFAIMFTSGTTGKPKGVEVTHAMLRFAGESAALVSQAGADDILFVWEPLFHIGGAQLLILPLIRDVKLAMVRALSISRFWDDVRRNKATHIHYLGGLLQMLLAQPASPRDRDHTVRIAWGAGCTQAAWETFRERFGIKIHECYGMTETSSITTYSTGEPIGSIGRLVPWLNVTILDADGSPAKAGQRGLFAIRADCNAVCTNYFEDETATSLAFQNGYFLTGDIVSSDAQGNFYFCGRNSDSVRSKGENVSAWEIEHVVLEHPYIAECAIIGVPGQLGEQDIKLFVRVKENKRIEPIDLSVWLTERLASYQNPRFITVVDQFEKTPSERVMKHRLSASVVDSWDRLAAGKEDRDLT